MDSNENNLEEVESEGIPPKTKADETVEKLNEVIITTVSGSFNFINSATTYINNDIENFKTIIIPFALKVGLAFILFESFLLMFGFNSITGLIPKIISLLLLYLLTRH